MTGTQITTAAHKAVDSMQSLEGRASTLLASREPMQKVDDGNGVMVMRRVRHDPLTSEEHALLTQYHGALVAATRPCNPKTLTAQLARRANHYKNERSDREWKMLFEDFQADLGEFSDEEIYAAFTEHRRTVTFFPKVAEIRNICLRVREGAQKKIDRCEKIMREGGARI